MLRMAAIMSLLAARAANAADTASPNDAIDKPDCDSSITVSIRYSSSSERLYLESDDGSTRGGCMTLTEIWEDLDGSAPLYAVDADSGDVSDTVTGTWLLTETLYVEDGITLQVTYTLSMSVCFHQFFLRLSLRVSMCMSGCRSRTGTKF